MVAPQVVSQSVGLLGPGGLEGSASASGCKFFKRLFLHIKIPALDTGVKFG